MDEFRLRQPMFQNRVIDCPNLSKGTAGSTNRALKRVRILTGISLILCWNLMTAAQDVVPPPGFSPGHVDDSSPVPVTEPKVFSGDSHDSELYDGIISGGYPNRSRALTRSRRYGRFPQPISPVLIEEAEPALPRVWFRSEALLWWSKSSPLPIPIVTLGSSADDIPGALGQPGTSILLGNQSIGLPARGGGRFTFGFSFDPAQTWGVEGSYFYLADATTGQSVTSFGGPGSAWLAFPFYDPTNSIENASPIALPGAFAGQAVVTLQTFLQGTDVNVLHNILNSDGVKVDLLGGFRYVNFQENLKFTTDSPNIDPADPGFFHTYDKFNVNNNFYGGQFGVRASIDRARFFANITGKMALGSTFEKVSVNGGTVTDIGGYASAPGAYLSQPTNIGSTTPSPFAVVPEMNLNVGVRLAPWASVIVGYSFLYISSVARPGDQLDRVINPTQSSAITNNFPASLSGIARPSLNVHSTDFWAQGLNFALEIRF